MIGDYENGEACLNGHPTTGQAANLPELTSKFCQRCGCPTIQTCPACDAKIRGIFYESWMAIEVDTYWEPPSYCHHCGKAYPWTKSRIEALAETIDDLEELPEPEKEKLKASIPDVISVTIKTETAIERFRKAISKVGGKFLGDVLAKVAAEVVIQQLGLK
jgi:hypothetical protein